MSYRENVAAAHAVIEYFVGLTERRADLLLRTAATASTPATWDGMPENRRRSIIEKRIAEGGGPLLARLTEAIPSRELMQELRSIAVVLSGLRAFELALLLEHAKAPTHLIGRGGVPKQWDASPIADRCSWLEDLLLAAGYQTRESLRTEAGLRSDAGLAPEAPDPDRSEPTAVIADETSDAASPAEATELALARAQPRVEEPPMNARTNEVDSHVDAPPPADPPASHAAVPAVADASSAGPVVPAVDVEGPIFVVHGHDAGILHEAVRVLERITSRKIVVLHEQANAGRTILEKFEDHAAAAAYAVVLLTADDVGGSADGEGKRPRGRQNVIFELGFFFGKLGRDRVAVLLDDGVEKPSDIDGLVYVSRDGPGAWRHTLAKELAAVGIKVDYAKIP